MMQTLFGSFQAVAIANSSTMQITMTSNGQSYSEGEVATNPVEVYVTTTSADSAAIEISQDNRNTWQRVDSIQPLVIEQEGEHELWFRLGGIEEKRSISIASPQVQNMRLIQATTMDSAIIYVKEGENGNGTSWSNAFGDLQKALEEAPKKLSAGATTVQIWLAQGTYKPTNRIITNDPRTATFQMQNNVAIYGGFNGTETDKTARDWQKNLTILSGDIDNTPYYNAGNAYHVFFHPGLSLNNTAILDGVTITGGNANDSSRPHSLGGGMYNLRSNPTLTNVVFDDNEAQQGGGMYGGYSSGLTLTNVIFHKNHATKEGGGVYNEGDMTSLSLINALFYANQALSGSAVYNAKGRFLPSALGLTNVTISDNRTTGTEKAAVYGGTVVIYNSIITGNNNEQALLKNGNLSIIKNSLLDVKENTDVTAKFHKTKTDIVADTYTSEDIFLAPHQQDYRLRAKSPAINTGDEQDYLDLTNEPKDLAGNSRQFGKIDLGAYEAFPYHVTYEENGATAGDVPIDKMTYDQGHISTVLNNSSLARTGYTFKDWNTQADGEGTAYAENATFHMGTGNVTLFAQWTADIYSVSFDSNGGSSVSTQQIPYQTKVNTPSKPTKQGDTFVGWYKDSTLTTEWNFTTDVVTETMTLYAKWTKKPTYTVIYDGNRATGGTVPQDKEAYEANEIVTVQNNSGNLVKTGYTFAGWNTQADGKGTAYAENATFHMGTGNVMLFAQWTPIPKPPTTGDGGNTAQPTESNDNDSSTPTKVKIRLHTNGGTVLDAIEIPYNAKVSDLPVPTREGYRFDGWYHDEQLTKPWHEETRVQENMTLYAKWTALPVEQPEIPQEPAQTQPIITYDDIKQHWAQEMIEKLATQGIIKGYEDGTFRPNAPISRMHVAALLTRAFSFEQVRGATNFTDIVSTHPYYEAIITLQQAGIIDGANGAFNPAENMTRAQLAKVLVGVLDLKPAGTSSFTDVEHDHWSAGHIAVLERKGIALGDNGEFHPNAPVTRAQFVAFLHRIMQVKNH